MENFKIALFESEHKQSFPEFKTLTQSECQSLVSKLSKKYSLVGNNIELELAAKQLFYDKANTTEDFKLLNTLIDLGINPMKNVIINWYKFQRLDEFKLDDVNQYFDDIWFPSSDDIDLFDENLDWIVSIRHDGCISFIVTS